MKLPVPNPKAMLADRGYDSDSFRQELLIHGILPVIPSRKGRSAPQKTDWRRYRDRNHIERMFNRLKQMRRIATRYDKTALSFKTFLNIAAARLWIKSFVNVTYNEADSAMEIGLFRSALTNGPASVLHRACARPGADILNGESR